MDPRAFCISDEDAIGNGVRGVFYHFSGLWDVFQGTGRAENIHDGNYCMYVLFWGHYSVLYGAAHFASDRYILGIYYSGDVEFVLYHRRKKFF